MGPFRSAPAIAIAWAVLAQVPSAPARDPIGPVHVADGRFRLEDGATWPWQGFSDFALFQRYARGESIGARLDERRGLGANVLRVFTMFAGTPGRADDQGIGAASGLGHLDPRRVPDYDAKLAAFADLLAAHGLRVEFVCLADNLRLNLDEHEQVARVFRAVGAKPNVFIEIANEPFKNVRAEDLAALVPPQHRALVATGQAAAVAAGGSARAMLDYVTVHSDRGPDWVQSPRELATMSDETARDLGRRLPIVADEPLGAGDADVGGRRSRRADDFRLFAALARLYAAGATFHSDNGIAGKRLSATQQASAKAFFEGLTWAPADVRLAPAEDGRDRFGPFCRRRDGFAWCVAPGAPASWQMPAPAGCRLDSRPWTGFWKWRCEK